MSNRDYFSSLTTELAKRAARASLSQLGVRSEPLRTFLRHRLEQPPGQEGSFVAEPVFEGLFGWSTADRDMRTLAGNLLHPELVSAMDRPPRELAEYRFGSERMPYTHQLEAWRLLGHEEPRSVIVTSGTGSGKTECFLVPILDDLVRERERRGRLVGVRALFLYPLNALINSQRDRLRAWSQAFHGDLRFCLYNGETPEQVPNRRQTERPEEVLSRHLLRQEPPPLLVTNATMLEYMLVRSGDAPILQASQGLLRWVVLDEVHTYMGSQAAELALLLRRVAMAFGVRADDLRYVATSATVGGDGEDSAPKLRRFLADVAGVSADKVHLVEGNREVPSLPESLTQENRPLPSANELLQLPEDKLFECLASNPRARRIRSHLASRPLALHQASKMLHEGQERVRPGERDFARTLQLLDLATSATHEGRPFLPLRGHVYHRTQPGLWACCDCTCKGRTDGLEDSEWPFGAVFLERHESCKHCRAPVFEVLFCNECGTEYLACEEAIDQRGRHLRQASPATEYDEFQEEFEALEPMDDEEAPPLELEGGALPRMIAAPGAVEGSEVVVSREDGLIKEADGETITLELLLPDSGRRFTCGRCGTHEPESRDVFRPARLGAPFLLGVAIPTLLEHTAGASGKAASGPFDGRRLLTFSDSRQGTARFAVKAQLDAERTHVRSVVYHLVAARRSGVADPQKIESLEKTIAELEKVAKPGSPLWDLLSKTRAELAAAQVVQPGAISWRDAAQALQNDDAIRTWMPEQWRHVAFGGIGVGDLPQFCLYREFLRRPKRLNSLETLGLAALDYPRLRDIPESQVPAAWRQRRLSAGDWRDFLKACVDFYVRAYTAADVPDHYIRWLGLPMRKSYLLGPDALSRGHRQVVWPLGPRNGRLTRVVRLLGAALEVDPMKPENRGLLEELLRDAWDRIRPMTRSYSDGNLLSLGEEAEIVEVREAWLCPVTNRLIDTTVKGLTPYLPENLEPSLTRCTRIKMPVLPHPYWRDSSDRPAQREEIQAWLEKDETVVEAREAGVWPEFSDRIASFAPYYRVAEHSAQQSGSLLRHYESLFKQGHLNILSCSTTMEMGVDIGGLNAVAMNNAPPSPANFLQRAGRAGRRGEAAAASLTLCKSNPHGEAVFRNPLWPFETALHVPGVSLQSERIVQRHINAVALGCFLGTTPSTATQHRLEVGWFLERDPPEAPCPAERFVHWCEDENALRQAGLLAAVEYLARRSVYDDVSPVRLLAETARQLDDLRNRWLEEVQSLLDGLEQFQDVAPGAGQRPPGMVAIERQLGRMRGEYLLSELATKNFLPGYGFPTGVVPFIPTTLEDLRRSETGGREDGASTRYGREDTTAVRRGYPAREISTAIREYAPGADLILDGRVYRSGGVTLNWHLPPTDHEVRELQVFRHAWRCRVCGLTGTHPARQERCPSCGGERVENQEYLQPSGFAVDIRYQAHNDISRPTYIPVQEPWVTAAGADWLSLARPEVGRYRYSSNGHIYHRTGGAVGAGFALCLRCGRAESEHAPNPSALPEGLREHARLRGGRDSDGDTRCPGNDEHYAIKRHLMLGAEHHSDVFELQLSDPVTGAAIPDRATAYSIGVALRHVLCESLGIEEREVGITAVLARTGTGGETWSVVIYDTAVGGAGYVAAAAQSLPSLLEDARGTLSCPRDCDDACHACLLTFDTQYHVDDLRRHKAMDFLTPELVAALKLPDELRAFGGDTLLEFEPLVRALRRELQRPEAGEIRIFLGDSPGDWDLLEWPAKDMVIGLAAEGVSTKLVVGSATLAALEPAVRNTLASMSEVGGLDILVGDSCPPEIGGMHMIAEVGGRGHWVRWAVPDMLNTVPGSAWANHSGEVPCVRVTDSAGLAPLDAVSQDGSALRRPPPGTSHEIRISTEADGPIERFGLAFWGKVLSAAPNLAARIKAEQPVVSVSYSDRYLRTPLMARLFQSLLGGWDEAGGAYSPELSVEIVTMELAHYSHRTPWKMSHDWDEELARKQVLKALLEPLTSHVTLKVRARAHVPHARLLTLTWGDGECWAIRLDEGLGYWSLRNDFRFGFDRGALQQASTLGSARLEVRARNPDHPTYLYVGAIKS